MNTLRFGLPEQAIEKINSVFASHPYIEKAVLYGSRAKGTFRNGSDIDLTLFGHHLTHDELRKVINELDDLLLPYTIDLSLFSALTHQGLVEHIERVGVVFYKTSPIETTA